MKIKTISTLLLALSIASEIAAMVPISPKRARGATGKSNIIPMLEFWQGGPKEFGSILRDYDEAGLE